MLNLLRTDDIDIPVHDYLVTVCMLYPVFIGGRTYARTSILVTPSITTSGVFGKGCRKRIRVAEEIYTVS